MKKYLITLLAATALLLAGCAGPSPVTPGSTTAAEDSTTNLTGEWGYSGDTFKFDADVTSGKITVHILLDDDSKGLYWTGTFPESAKDGESITSKADTEALASSLYGSSDEEKTFKFEGGKLVYEFTIMGTLTKVSLEKR